MLRVHITYKVADDKVEENKAAVREFIEKVRAAGDTGYRYESFQSKKDPTRFTHVGFFDDPAAKDRFQATEHFKPFADGLSERAVEGPEAVPMEIVATSADVG
jgi:quinol monooxygenase YgiN